MDDRLTPLESALPSSHHTIHILGTPVLQRNIGLALVRAGRYAEAADAFGAIMQARGVGQWDRPFNAMRNQLAD